MRLRSATAAVKEYLGAAAMADAKAMRKATQRSYAGGANTGMRSFVTGFRVEREEPVEGSRVMADVFVWIKVQPYGEQERMFRLRCICEDREGHPTPEGSWGVNPASVRPVDNNKVEETA